MLSRFTATAAFVSALLLAGAPVRAAEQKGPPSCAKIEFRPVPAGQNDGEVDAGLYKSRFGKLELRAAVKSGEPQDYYVVVNGKKLAPVSGALPKSVESCAAEKKVPAPSKATDTCTGDKFAVLINHAGQQKIAALYGRQGGKWQFCRASQV